jgi:hypothetical protein
MVLGGTEEDRMSHSNRLTIGVSKVLAICYLLGSCSSSVFAATDNRHGQKTSDLTVSETVLTSFGDGVPCLRMKIVVQPSQFGGRTPNRIVLTTVLNETLHANWRLHAASWALASNPRVLVEATVRLEEEPISAGTPIEAVFDGLVQGDASYILNLDLRPIEKEESIAREYLNAGNAKSRALVAAKLRQKYKDLYKASADEIVHREGVRISQDSAQ